MFDFLPEQITFYFLRLRRLRPSVLTFVLDLPKFSNVALFLGIISLVVTTLALLLTKLQPLRNWLSIGSLAVNSLLLLLILLFANLTFALGIAITVRVAVFAYLLAALLGITLAGLLMLGLGENTLKRFGIAGTILALASIFFFTRPLDDYTLIGSVDGRIAIIDGTPDRIADMIKARTFEGEKTIELEPLSVRGVDSLETALARLQEGIVTGAFIPTAQVPAKQDKLWQVKFLPDSARNPALLLLTLGIIILLLTFAGWVAKHHPLAVFAELYVDLMRGIPMLVIILYIGFPVIGALRDATGGRLEVPLLLRGIIGISLGYAAYMAEIFRAGIQAIPKGQYEASRSLGLSGWQTARYIIMPQALKIVIPPLGNEFIAMLKDTALLSVLSVRDITQRTREFASATFTTFPPFNTVAILYIILTLAAASLIKWVERRTDIRTR